VTTLTSDNALRVESVIWQEVFERGVAHIAPPLPRWVWQRLYDALDAFADFVAANSEYATVFDTTAKAWQADRGLEFSGYFSPYFRNRVGQAGKDQKYIFQICEPYFRYLADQQPRLLALPTFARLAESALATLYSLHAAMLPLMRALRAKHPGLHAALMQDDVMPPVVLRLLHYRGDGQFFTDPHVDKSAVTVIVNTDDPVDDPCLVFAPSTVGTPLLSEFRAVRKHQDEALVFLGAAGREAGFSGCAPAPHAVRPARVPRTRHSAIFFWLLPGIDLRSFSTAVPFVDDLGHSRAEFCPVAS